MEKLWEEHLACEFQAKMPRLPLTRSSTALGQPRAGHDWWSRSQAVDTLLRSFFIPQMPPDRQFTPVSRTIGPDRLVDEFVIKFTHSLQMDWLLPGVPPTNKPVEVAIVTVIQFQDGKMASERIYYDQASILVQLGLLDPEKLPVAGVEIARKVLDDQLPSNELMKRTLRDKDL